MMRVFLKTLRDNRRGWIGWSLALAAVAAMYSSFWPSMNNPTFAQAMESYPDSMKKALHLEDIATPAGYFSATVFGLLIPFLVAVFGILAGVKSIAGDEEAGTLDLILAHPVKRQSVALQRIAAVAVGLALITGLICLAVIGLRGPSQFTDLSVANIVAISTQLGLFGLLFAALTFAVGAATGKRALAIAAGAAVAVLGYLSDSFLPQIESLKWTESLSPFDWYLGGEPLRNGLQFGHSGLLLGVSLLLIAVGTWAFTRRDIAV